MGRPAPNAECRTPNADAGVEPFQRAGDTAVNAETDKTLEVTQSVTRPPDNPTNPATKDQRSKKAREDEEGKGPQENPEFCDVDRDLESLGEFVRRFLSEHGRWGSPVFVAGESYWGYRVARLARRLQDGHGVGLSGALLISPAIEVDALTGSDNDLTYWLEALPAYTATALHHGRGDHGEGADLDAVLRDAESFARDDLCRWFALGDALGTEEVGRIAGRMST